jgi:hypothetical protein
METHTTLDQPSIRQAACRVDFYLIYMAIGVPGFKVSWTARSRARAVHDRHSDSNLCLVREFPTAVTSSTATHAIPWVDQPGTRARE